ncbi:MAG: secretin N-terminal domain-containing protein [Candidatus Auribacterota bacterium]|jgi:type II secretory pathway component GspD/PulD (secretin)|nr:secretin N-terminal domain-containing protein [Candidatus Auribacterota bacterium]
MKSQTVRFFILGALLSAMITVVIIRLGAAQPLPPPGEPSKAERGMEYMRARSQEVMTGSESRDALRSKASGEEAQTISLELRNINIVDILKILSQTGGINIVAGPSVRGNTTIFLEDVNVWDALRIILEINALAYIQDGDILKVMSEKEYEDIYGVPFHNTAQTRVFKLKYALAEDVNRAITPIKSTKGKIIIDERTNTLIIIDTPDAMTGIVKIVTELDVMVATRVYQLKYTTPKVIEEIAKDIVTKKGIIQTDPITNKIIITDTVESLDFIESIINEYDQKPYTETRTYFLRFASYEDIETKVQELLTEEVGLVISDKRTNALVITDYPDKINDIVKVVETLDTMHKQVMIDCKLITVTLTDDFAMGIDFERLFKANNYDIGLEEQFGATIGGEQTFPTPERADITSPSGFNSTGRGTGGVFTLGKVDDFRAVVRLLKQVGSTKLLSEPRITVMNNAEAQIQVGTDEPFVTSSSTLNVSTTSVAEDIQFIEVGVLLSVTPTINDSGYVTMKIKPEVSQVSDRITTSQSNQIPVVQTSELETTVMVRDGVTIVLGGLIEEFREKRTSRLPVLGSIPVFGIPFRSTKTSIDQRELLVFLTPHIVSVESDMFDPRYSRSFSREFLHSINELEAMNEEKFAGYLEDEKKEQHKKAIKQRALDARDEMQNMDKKQFKKLEKSIEKDTEERKQKLFFGIF